MKKFYLFVTFLIIVFTGNAQNIKVLPGDFYRDNKDLIARTHPVTDDNAQTCALLKIITTEKNFTFEPDAYGICKPVEYKTAEIWVWLAPGSRCITIKHPQFGQLRDYVYPEAIEASTVYVMKLTTAKISTVVEDVNTSNYLALTVNPPEASVKIDGKMLPVSGGQYQGRLSVGKHSYEASCEMYHSAKGEFVIRPDSTTYFTIELKPNYGFLKVESTPESGALVYVNNKQVGETPYESDKLETGKYTVQVVKDMYKEAKKEVWVKENETTTALITMVSDFAEPVIACADADAEIWVNDELKAKGSWTGRLAAGPYKVEVKKDRCRTASQQFELKSGDKPTIDLPVPEPIYGKLDVTTEPWGAEIYLNGNKMGLTPRILDKVQIGEYNLELKKEGCVSVSKQIEIEEGKTVEVNEAMKTGVTVIITATPVESRANVVIDGKSFGLTPVSTSLSIGVHQVTITPMGSYKNLYEDEIEVRDGGQTVWKYDVSPNVVPVQQVKVNKNNDKLEITYYLKEMASVSMSYMLKGVSSPYSPETKNVRGGIGVDVLPGKKKIVFDINKEFTDGEYIDEVTAVNVTAKKQKMGFFFTANAAYAFNPQWSFGLTFGAMKRWGWYVDVMSNFNFDGIENTMNEGAFYELTGKNSTLRHSLMAGAVFRACKPLSVKLGVGVGYRARNYEARNVDQTSYTMYADPQTKLFGLNAEAGVMFHVKKLVLTASAATINFKYLEFKAGVGMYFPSVVQNK